MKMMGITVTMIITVIMMMISNDNTRERRGPQGCVLAPLSTRCLHLLREREGEGESESERVRERERVLVCGRLVDPVSAPPGASARPVVCDDDDDDDDSNNNSNDNK